ncbi:hypothetical protein [Rhizobium sp. AB2/73]|uniref:hypothetical protein n=1 Tax=Rhizobium sp. AB2/73 TaxID=2795216 RepID=UPI001C5FA784|nr:hypothetical protein [Rhizobium sp. AB2/73]QYA11934.1 hypothetical protein J5284_15580 [Rhizobium sp. AB2/73]UEQ82135.1 hypothetical protein I8E17_06425 [Rhizobium sp. AB2/73]
MIDSSRAIGGYAAVMTLTTAWLALTAVATPTASFSTIEVQRINVREPDGTLRMTISNHARIPGVIIAGKEHPNPNRTEAGMIFYNDQGDENGGLIFDGGMKNGKPTNGGSLTFDRYHQDQTIQLVSSEDGVDRRAGLVVNDRPDIPLNIDGVTRARDMPPGSARDALLVKSGATAAQRAWLGRSADGSVALVLRDPAGRPRLTLAVNGDGTPLVEFRNSAGIVTRTMR